MNWLKTKQKGKVETYAILPNNTLRLCTSIRKAILSWITNKNFYFLVNNSTTREVMTETLNFLNLTSHESTALVNVNWRYSPNYDRSGFAWLANNFSLSWTTPTTNLFLGLWGEQEVRRRWGGIGRQMGGRRERRCKGGGEVVMGRPSYL